MKKEELRYLQRLAELYPTIGKASTEIINLQSILNLPKGTEHFMSDIHGEYEAFAHVLRNGSCSAMGKGYLLPRPRISPSAPTPRAGVSPWQVLLHLQDFVIWL